ncbi:uridine diphosphate glucose pyrophosphatase NUDT14-like isoform X2 [Haliotis rufescens]|uniref:uridine diphosphate glucose pyrophosphatase NUDT14-like isoform X2 n=1 Tax=Haliotis rufescens TaxID=6454 RepID=UPI001EAFC457|nr:uridine diphosphate glucose pyrophosphatase NUDT14-like isoform X2 [Haliotis rufescens]
MDEIEDVHVSPCTESLYIKPMKINYKQNHEIHSRDIIKEHDDVVILVYNKTRKVFVLVKQFRPAIYLTCAEMEEKDGQTVIDTSKYPGSLGVTYELCAGIIDKNHSTQEIAQMELLEECGYKVALDSIEKVASYRNGVGTTGSMQTMYFVEVTDAMKVGEGGGVAQEGEMIEVVDIPVKEGRDFLKNEKYNIPLPVLFGINWYYENKASQD